MIRYVCNGSPKTGTHALHRIVSLFYNHIGLPIHDHVEYRRKDPDYNYINITRHPKNVLVSWNRFNGYPVDGLYLLQEMKHIIEEMRLYTAWSKDSTVLNVRFETLFTDDTLQKIATHIDQDPVEDHLKKAWGGTHTFTGRHSNWRDLWTDVLEEHWVLLGGLDLERELGYAD